MAQRRYSTQGPQMAILATVMAAVVGYLYGHHSGSVAEKDDIAKLLRQDEVSSECRAQINKASEAQYWHEDARDAAFRGYDRY